MKNIPKTVAIIMDGNRRWALKKGLDVLKGHKEGVKSLKKIIQVCETLNVSELTFFAFSTENWKRDPTEVKSLLKLMEFYVKSEIVELNEKNINFNVIGDVSHFSRTLINLIEHAEKLTLKNDGLKLNIALNYGGKSDILKAVKEIAHEFKNDHFSINEINENLLKSHLYSSSVKDIDLLIRTGGEHRISNFMLWQLTYSEIFISDTLWPDFNEENLLTAIEFYSGRNRRFGATTLMKSWVSK